MIENRTNTYKTRKEILQFPDDYVAQPQFFDEQSKLAVKENGRYIVKAGTPFPSNDANAVGVVLNDLDVTNGDQNGAVLVRGHVNLARCEANCGKTISAAAKTALKGIFFYPLTSTVIAEQTIISLSGSAPKVGDVAPTFLIDVTGTDLATLKKVATLSNYTIATGTTALTVSKIEKVDDKQLKVTCTGTAVAGTLTIAVGANAVVNATASNTLSVVVA